MHPTQIRKWLEPVLVAASDLFISIGYGIYLVTHQHVPHAVSGVEWADLWSWSIVAILGLCGILSGLQFWTCAVRVEALVRLGLAFPLLSGFSVLGLSQHDWLAFGFGAALAIAALYRWFLLTFWRLPLQAIEKHLREGM